jgi:hypothetical protein
MTAVAAKGFLTYLGLAIRLELSRPGLELRGGKEGAQAAILETLRQFKEKRAK